MTVRIVDNGTTLRAYNDETYLGGAYRTCIGGSRGRSWYWAIEFGWPKVLVATDVQRKPEALAELTRLAKEGAP